MYSVPFVYRNLATAATANVTNQPLTKTQLVAGTVVGGATAGIAAAPSIQGAKAAGDLARMSRAPVNSPQGIGSHIAENTIALGTSSTKAGAAQGFGAGLRDAGIEAAGKGTEAKINNAEKK